MTLNHPVTGSTPVASTKNMSSFHERKAERVAYFEKYVRGWKLRKCTACNGSGYYDSWGSPSCCACNGTGKERYKPQS